MKKRRGNKEGSIYQRSNESWRAQILIDGKRLSHTTKTRKDAQNWLREIRNQMDQGLTHKGATITFTDFLDEWMVTKKHQVADQTYSYYQQIINDYIKPELGKIKLRELTTRNIQLFYNKKVQDGLGLRTVQKSHTIIHASLNSARNYGIISYNPDDATNPPKPKTKEMMFLNQDQIKRLLDETQVMNKRNYGFYYIAIVTGMREGELLSLKWQNIDLDKRILNVKTSLKRIPGGGLIIDKPKTKASLRSIKLGRESIIILKTQKQKIDLEKQLSFDYWQENDLVFPSTTGTPIDPSNMLKQFRKVLDSAGLPKIRFHDLRHTAASLMISNGVDVLVVSKRLGHAKPSITLDVYGHMMPSIQSKAADILDNLLSK